MVYPSTPVQISMSEDPTQAGNERIERKSPLETDLKPPNAHHIVTDGTPGIALSPATRVQSDAIVRAWNFDLSLSLNDIALDGDLIERALAALAPPRSLTPKPSHNLSLPPMKASSVCYETLPLPPLPPKRSERRRYAMIIDKPEDDLPDLPKHNKGIDSVRKPSIPRGAG
ncbi:hypothetical protein PGT21_003228 [Puccinia graminis f. sp. tritici]|uniref:Uncharacterized protein n=1 Tax=Puccinia graminis f. sp. tritici TaxID=56615 RepID=A0A5B0SH47_PUCGR|nr:hypothetical protein PGT21_003228 [Puccinia graminis f. sp. tritici]KAA1137162.1 hypothetical protein PGTUg99_007116 [Puccinia graminis f. sp. tritici]